MDPPRNDPILYGRAKNTYNFLRVVAKSVAEHLYQNQAINIAILKDQYILSGTGLTHGE